MADSDWQDAPSGAVPLNVGMALNDQYLQSKHPNWPTGGTSTQLGIESNYNNDAVSPKGATGIGQFMPDTWKAIEEQTGRTLDPKNVNDQLFAHRYLMDQNLQRTNGDPSGALSLYNSGRATPDNPETINYVNKFNQKLPSQDERGWENVPTQQAQPSASDWETVPKGTSAHDKATAILAGSREQANQAVNQVQGLGEVAASGLTGMFGQAAGLLHGGAELAQGKGLEAAKQAFQQEVEPVTYQPRTPEGIAANERLGQGYEQFIQNPAEHLAQAGMSLITDNPKAQEYAKTYADVLAGFAAATLGGGEVGRGAARVPEVGVPKDVLGKLAPDEAVVPSAQRPSEFVGPQQEGMGPLQEQPNAGPQQQFIVNEKGIAARPNEPVSMEQAGAEIGRELYGSKLAEKRLAETPAREYDTVEARAGKIAEDPINLSDPTSDVSHPAEKVPAERMAAPEEFAQAVQTLADKAPDKFSVPADMDRAYEHYQKIVGGDLEPGPMADRFAKAVAAQMADDRVAAHPTVRANQARVDSFQARLADAQAKQGPTSAIQKQLDRAQQTLDKSKANIAKEFGTDPYAPKVKDGIVNLYTFGHLPSVMKSIGAVLKALHGVVFKTFDKLLPNQRKLDTRASIFAQGIKDAVRKEATRDWSQTVNQKPIEQMSKIPGLKDAVTELNPHAQEALSPAQLKQQFNQAMDLSESKIGNFLRSNLLQGGLMLSDFSRHPLVKYTTDAVAKAYRSSDKWARENLLNKQTGLGPMMKRMSTDDFTAIRSLMEANEGIKEFTANELRGRGYGDDAIKYYTRSLELQKDAFNKFNQGRQLAGLKPVEARIAHIAGYFTGDFKQIVKDSSGKIVAVLGHNDRGALGTIAKRFQELHPDGANLDMGKPFLRKGAVDDNTFNGFMNILNEMSKTNADVERLVQAYHDVQMANTNKLSQMANRGKFKTSPENRVGGAEGQKLWQSMQKNAQDGGRQQLKYLESVNRWTEFQKAIQKSQDFISDPEVNAPNAKAVSQKYLDNQMHRNLGELNKFTNSFVNGIADITGVGPTTMRQMSNLTKTGLLNMFVGLGNFRHSLVTSLQPMIGMPGVTSMLKANGAKFGAAQASSIVKAMSSVTNILHSMATGKGIKDDFVRAANQYAKDNDTFNTSQFNMGSVTHPSTKLGNVLHINVTVPESGARAYVYMRYAHMLKDANDGSLSDREIFGAAHNATQKVMADYNREASAPIYNKMGFLGDLTRMLTTFKMNQISQYATATKMFGQGKVTPMMTMLATSIASAGLRGFIGYNIANGLLGQVTTWATKQGMMKQPTNLDQILLHMLHGANPHLRDSMLFGATSALGIDMTGSLSHADDIPDDPLGTLIPEGNPITKMLGSSLTAMEHPNTRNVEAAVYDTLPNSMKGIMENMTYTDDKGHYFDPHTGNLVTTRSTADQAKRAFGFHPIEESKMRLETEVSKGQEQQLGEVKAHIIKNVLSDADSNNGKVPNIQKYVQDYQQAGGQISDIGQALVRHLGMDKARNILERQAGIPTNYVGAEKYQRVQELK